MVHEEYKREGKGIWFKGKLQIRKKVAEGNVELGITSKKKWTLKEGRRGVLKEKDVTFTNIE